MPLAKSTLTLDKAMKKTLWITAIAIGGWLLPCQASAQSRGAASYDFSRPVSAKAAVLICETDCARSEVAVSVPLDRVATVERWWSGMQTHLPWKPLPTATAPSGSASCSTIETDLSTVSRDLAHAERTIARMQATGFYYAADRGSPALRVSSRDRRFGDTVNRWKTSHQRAFAVATQMVQEWNQRGCAQS